jgi:MFS transporter, DHA1 family, multidrug resistance protein
MMMGALAIDTVLPTFPDVRQHLGLPVGSNRLSLLITMYMFGLGSGQLLLGMLSDRFGRRRMLIVTLFIYAAAAVATTFAPSLAMMAAARFVWGFGAGGPRVAASAMIRDTYQGVKMAQTLSYVQAIFVIVPVFAPTISAGILHATNWRIAICFPALMALLLVLWIMRIPETLRPENRREFDVRSVASTARELRTFPATIWYSLAIMFLMGSLTSYIGITEQIIEETYHRGHQFAFIFGAIALVMGISTLVDAALVGRFGLQKMVRFVPIVLFAHSSVFAIISVLFNNRSPFLLYCLGIAGLLALQTLVIPNCNAAAMLPVGHFAGAAAGVTGTMTTLGGAMLGLLVTSLHTSGTNVLSIGQAILAGGCFLSTLIARRVGQSAVRVSALVAS